MSDAIKRLEWLSPEHIEPILDFIDRQAELAAKGELRIRPITEEEATFVRELLKQRRDAEDPEHRYGFRRNDAIQPQFNDEKVNYE